MIPCPNDSVSINSIIESRDAIFDENRFSSIPRPKDIIPNSVESHRDDHSDDVPSEIPEPRKGKRVRKAKSYGFDFQLYLVEGSRDQVGYQYSYCYNIEEYPRTYDEVIQSRDAAFWKEAIDDEIGSIMENNTWVLYDLPPGCKPLDNKHKVCKLVKSLYGLKQAPKQWHKKFDEVVLSSGFHLNQSDKRVYSKFDNSDKDVIICLYVDDMLIFETDQNQVDKTKKFLSSRFSIKDMGEADVILGIKIKLLESYSDASWINHVEDSSSTSGWVFLLGGGAISWASKKQTCITGSTIEYEFEALAAAGKKSRMARKLDTCQMYNGKSRHLGVRHSMIRELIMNDVISIEFVQSQQNLADHLTKGLARDLVNKSVGMD
nr:zinc finger, CCHC-type [Tanacetum cinerariifolium]